MTSPPPRSADQVARLVRRCLEEGRRVGIERLGVFRLGRDGEVEFSASHRTRIFLAYAEEDGAAVERLFTCLHEAGFDPWMDRRKLLPGQNWPRAIEGAIETADFFIACLSRRSVSKRGAFQSEMRYALDCARHSPFDDIYFIPARLEECSVPARIRQQLQYIDLFPDFSAGAQKIVQMIRKELRRRQAR
ncbi:MAG: toll/interleukin-1 receptor domain-containing protein [Candidatus Solibacter usitatus]|nr:toll/interleukin-1 receptor domain-containing protein [Candidatus Solibacter usitatus]